MLVSAKAAGGTLGERPSSLAGGSPAWARDSWMRGATAGLGVPRRLRTRAAPSLLLLCDSS